MNIWDEFQAWLAGRRTEELKSLDAARRHNEELTRAHRNLKHELEEIILARHGEDRRRAQTASHPCRRYNDVEQGRRGKPMPSMRYRPRDRET